MSKLNKILFGRRTLAILVAIVMVLQLLPMATFADTARADAAVKGAVGVAGGEEDGKPGDEDFNPGGLIGDPELPQNPSEPEESAEPAEPAEPADPETPAEPENPEAPAEPENPEEPAEPEAEEEGNEDPDAA